MADTVEFAETVYVGDPCYFRETDYAIREIPVVAGEWLCETTYSDEGDFGMRVAELRVKKRGAHVWRTEHHTVAGVDSGQMMVLSGDVYYDWRDEEYNLVPNGKGGADVEHNVQHYGRLTYNGACLATLSSDSGVLSGKAFVTRTGYGDGAYPVFVGKDSQGRVVEIVVRFIGPDEDVKQEAA